MAALRLIHDAHDEACFYQCRVPVFRVEVIENANAGDWHPTQRKVGKNFNILQGPFTPRRIGEMNSWRNLILTFHHALPDGMSAVFFL
jgi:hypothetical protein